jgi:hypothetical protein
LSPLLGPEAVHSFQHDTHTRIEKELLGTRVLVISKPATADAKPAINQEKRPHPTVLEDDFEVR